MGTKALVGSTPLSGVTDLLIWEDLEVTPTPVTQISQVDSIYTKGVGLGT